VKRANKNTKRPRVIKDQANKYRDGIDVLIILRDEGEDWDQRAIDSFESTMRVLYQIDQEEIEKKMNLSTEVQAPENLS
jgi:hypothetical protein